MLSQHLPIDRRTAANVVGFALLVVVVGLFVAAAVPQVVGADESYVVRSDSMSPAIDAGAVVWVSEVPTERIERGDVITFRRGNGPDGQLVTHRVVEVVEGESGHRFRTKGDANEDPDPELVDETRVVGVVQFDVPLMGYVVSFAQSGLGVLALVVVPAVLLIALEVRDLLAGSPGDGDGG